MDNLNSNVSDDDQEEGLTHQEAMALYENGIENIIQSDPLLNYLPTGVTLEELNSLLAFEHGRAMMVHIDRADGERYSVLVEQIATVLDLKKAIRDHFCMKQKRAGDKKIISWRNVWKRYWLYYEGQKLTPDNSVLKDFGIRNNSEVTFLKRLRIK